MPANPVTCTYRVDSTNEAHTTITVWVGRNEGARGYAGKLVMRTDEFEDLRNTGVLTLRCQPNQ